MIKSLAECPIGAEVTTRNGSKWLFLGNKLNTTYKHCGQKPYICLLKSNLGEFQTYDNNFKHTFNSADYDIISITDKDSNIIYKYEEPICEMTLVEIEKALGKKIKIVEDEKLTDKEMAEYIKEKCNKYNCDNCPLIDRESFCYCCDFDDPCKMAYLRENYKIMKEAENNAE